MNNQPSTPSLYNQPPEIEACLITIKHACLGKKPYGLAQNKLKNLIINAQTNPVFWKAMPQSRREEIRLLAWIATATARGSILRALTVLALEAPRP